MNDDILCLDAEEVNKNERGEKRGDGDQCDDRANLVDIEGPAGRHHNYGLPSAGETNFTAASITVKLSMNSYSKYSLLLAITTAALLSGCTGRQKVAASEPEKSVTADPLPGMPPVLDPTDIYSEDH